MPADGYEDTAPEVRRDNVYSGNPEDNNAYEEVEVKKNPYTDLKFPDNNDREGQTYIITV